MTKSKIKINGFYLDMNARNINTNIDQLIPKYEMKQQVSLITNFLFCSVDSNKQDKLAKNNEIQV